MTDWSHQERGIEMLRESLRGGKRRPIFQLPTGGGKTHVASIIIKNATRKGKRVLFLAPRRELIKQCAEKFVEEGLNPGIIMAGYPKRQSDIQVASLQTLHRRGIKDRNMLMPRADVLIVDEAHLSIADTYQEVIDYYQDSVIIGLTATPARGDGRGLGEVYDDIVSPASYSDLMDAGVLVRPTYYAPVDPNLEGVKVARGDYVVSDLDQLMNTDEQAGDIYDNWKRIAGDRKTVIFCCSISHATYVCDTFRAKGVRADVISADTPENEREEIMHRIHSGETQVICNVFMLSYGIDIPDLECAVLARPTKNITLYLQTVGRVIRSAPGKTDAIVIDHSGAIKENGLVEQEWMWNLGDDSNVKEATERKKKEKKEPKEIVCTDCGTVFAGRRDCPMCGLEMIQEGEPVPYYEDDLVMIDPEVVAKQANRTYSKEQKEEFFGMLKWYCEKHCYSPGWASHKYRAKFGVWPNAYKGSEVRLPSAEVLTWIEAQNRAYTKPNGKGKMNNRYR